MHVFTWNFLMAATANHRLKKNLEASFVAFSRPQLNEQIDLK